jgi:murein L,D-transpeptidase YcbB/YkuD
MKTFLIILSYALISFNAYVIPAGAVLQGSSVDRYIYDQTANLIRVQLAAEVIDQEMTLGGQPLYSSEQIRRFYERRDFRPAWTTGESKLNNARTLVRVIEDVYHEGLVPDYYHLGRINNLIDYISSRSNVYPEALAEVDVLLTDAFLMLGCHFSAGCINPVTIEAEWFMDRSMMEIDVYLEDALRENNIAEALRDLLPPQEEYTGLSDSLRMYREIVKTGGWRVVRAEGLLKKGDDHMEIVNLKRRLTMTGDLEHYRLEDESLFDSELEQAVMRFQKRHGINADGIVGPDTMLAMNVSAEKRLRQIEVNLERMRWLARNLGHRYIIINIADFKLEVVEHNKRVMSMEVVAGKPYQNTPIFSKTMTHLILNPSWHIPDSIAKEEIVPDVKRNPGYLKKNNMKIYKSWRDKDEEIAPQVIDWDRIVPERFPYILRQDPGPLNPLGRIKFMLPNKYNIYLHDTPSRGLFAENSRAFSHGCIRLYRPIDLAEYLLTGDEDWDRSKIETAIENNKETRIDILYPINVHIVYLTAWVDREGFLQFRSDVYERDENLARALKKATAGLSGSAESDTYTVQASQ